MVEARSETSLEATVLPESAYPDVSQLVTEDDTPVDNFASAKQQRLLVSSLYSSLSGRRFLAEANVGIYRAVSQPAIVPDAFVSFDVQTPDDWWQKQNRCYMVWNFGKPPEIAIEVVSNRVGNELTEKLAIYEQMRVSYYAVYDPSSQLSAQPLRLFELRGMQYTEMAEPWLEQVRLGLTLWEGEFEGRHSTWLRWQGPDGRLLLTGDERAEQAEQRAERLAAMLRERGIDPDELPD